MNPVSGRYRVAPLFVIRMAGVAFDRLAELATTDTAAAARNGTGSLPEVLAADLARSRSALIKSAREVLPRYLVFGMQGFSERVATLLAHDAELGSRNSDARKREKHLLLYLQRVCAKNDTFSEFGPSAWGRVVDEAREHLAVDCSCEIASREAFLERWTGHAIAAAISADPDTRDELAPRVNPSGLIANGRFVFTDTGESIELDAAAAELVAKCDGVTPLHALGVDAATLARLEAAGVLHIDMQVPALEPHAAHLLVDDVAKWRADNPARGRWLRLLEPLAALPKKFAASEDAGARAETMNEARERLRELGASRTAAQRSLYAASNPIAEECALDGRFEVSAAMADELANDAAPWFDLWRDTYAFVASRVAGTLRRFLEAGSPNGVMPLPAFLKLCESQRLPLTSVGMVGPAVMAFAEVKAAFQAMLGDRATQPEVQLTQADCQFVQRAFDYPKFDEYTYPSADLQISARSVEAVNRGEYEWIVSELHPPVALLHHAFYWSCPDQAALGRAIEAAACGKPAFHYGFFAADFTGHTAVQQMEAIPELMTFVAPQRARPGWRKLAPAEADVFVDNSGDVGLRRRADGEYLGSFARAWVIPLGFHPFHFGRAPHMPRLRCGKVIVQRRAWTISNEELPGKFKGVSAELVTAIDRLREARELPRFVYVRPTEQALRRSGAEGRDKDTKPVFIDLESYLFMEIFQRWLSKSGELEVTEMLPDPDHLFWRDGDGARTFELRTLILPR